MVFSFLDLPCLSVDETNNTTQLKHLKMCILCDCNCLKILQCIHEHIQKASEAVSCVCVCVRMCVCSQA
jgi:hypothetical protein